MTAILLLFRNGLKREIAGDDAITLETTNKKKKKNKKEKEVIYIRKFSFLISSPPLQTKITANLFFKKKKKKKTQLCQESTTTRPSGLFPPWLSYCCGTPGEEPYDTHTHTHIVGKLCTSNWSVKHSRVAYILGKNKKFTKCVFWSEADSEKKKKKKKKTYPLYTAVNLPYPLQTSKDSSHASNEHGYTEKVPSHVRIQVLDQTNYY